MHQYVVRGDIVHKRIRQRRVKLVRLAETRPDLNRGIQQQIARGKKLWELIDAFIKMKDEGNARTIRWRKLGVLVNLYSHTLYPRIPFHRRDSIFRHGRRCVTCNWDFCVEPRCYEFVIDRSMEVECLQREYIALIEQVNAMRDFTLINPVNRLLNTSQFTNAA